MAIIKTGIPTVSELIEGDTTYRHVPGQGLISYTKRDNQLYSTRMYPNSIPPLIGKQEATVLNTSQTILVGGGGDGGTVGVEGSYVATVAGGTGIDSTGSTTGEGIEHTLSIDLNELSDTAMVVGDSIVFIDADDDGSKKESVADVVTLLAGDGLKNSSNTFTLDVHELTEAAIQTGDYLAFSDENVSNDITKRESIDDIATLFAGDGLTASSAVIGVDVSDFAGTGLEDDSSENLRLASQGTGISGGAGSTLSITPAQTSITSIINSGMTTIGTAADQEYIKFDTSNEINTLINNTERLSVTASGIDVTGTITASTSVDITGSTGLVLENDETITNSSNGYIALSGNLVIPDAGTIGSASDTDAVSISSAGLINMSQTATVGSSTAAGNMSDLLESAQETALADALAADNNSFDFATGTTDLVVTNGFVAASATFANVSGSGKLTNTASSAGSVRLDLTTVVDKIYECIFSVITGDTTNVEVSLSASTNWNTGAASGPRDTGTLHSLVHNFKATGTTSYLHIRNLSITSGHYSYIDDLKVREARTYSGAEIGSSHFLSGFAGSGWKIDKDGTADNEFDLTVDNMFVRGRLSIYELLIQQIRATNGAIFVTSAAKVESTSGLSATDAVGSINFNDPSGHGICPFAVNDLIMMQRVVPGAFVGGDAEAGTKVGVGDVIKKLLYKVTAINGATASVTGLPGGVDIGFTNTSFPDKGDDFVRIGNTSDPDRQGIIYLTSDDSNAPFIDIKDDIDSYADWHSTATTKARLGKLSGITHNSASLSGYGLYSGNVYLTGDITATTGYIGGTSGWVIGTNHMYGLASGTPGSSPTDGIVMTNNGTAGLTVYEDAHKRIELGYLSSGVYGLKGFDGTAANTVFELSDTATQIAGWTFTQNAFYKTATTTIGLTTAGHADSPAGIKAQFFAGASGGNATLGGGASIAFANDGKIYGNGIYVKNGIDYLITSSRIFGNGSDGDVTLSGTTSLSRDMYYDNLTINSGILVRSNGYRIFVRNTLTLGGSGIIINNDGFSGEDGGDGSSDDSAGTAGYSTGTGAGNGEGGKEGSLRGGARGSSGGVGGTGQGVSSAGTGAAGVVTVTTPCVRTYTTSNGAGGGDGDASGGAGGTSPSGVTAGEAAEGNISITNSDLTFIIAMRDIFAVGDSAPSLYPSSGAAGGGGGGGGGHTGDPLEPGDSGGGGGQGGGGGGHVMLIARIISGTQSHLTLRAKGGNGGDGGSSSTGEPGGAGGKGAGGNGGDGGCVTVMSGTLPTGITITVTGGTKGDPGSSGAADAPGTASDGGSGTSIVVHC